MPRSAEVRYLDTGWAEREGVADHWASDKGRQDCDHTEPQLLRHLEGLPLSEGLDVEVPVGHTHWPEHWTPNGV